MSIHYVIQALLDGLLIGGVYGLVSLGLTLVFGVMGIINFAHGAMMMLGMYTAYWGFALWGISPYVSLPVTIAILFVIGAVVQRMLIQPVLNAPQHNQLLITLGLMLFLENLALFLWSPDFRTLRLPGIDGTVEWGVFLVNRPRLIAFLFSVAVTVVLYVVLQRTRLGKAMRATAQDREGAVLVGLDVRKVYMLTFGLSTGLVGLAGALTTPFLYTAPQVGHVFLLFAFVIVVLGGLGSFVGALVGGLVVGVAESLGALLLPGSLKEMVVYVLFLLVLLYRPTGLFGGR